jgi:hypothetical protein
VGVPAPPLVNRVDGLDGLDRDGSQIAVCWAFLGLMLLEHRQGCGTAGLSEPGLAARFGGWFPRREGTSQPPTLRNLAWICFCSICGERRSTARRAVQPSAGSVARRHSCAGCRPATDQAATPVYPVCNAQGRFRIFTSHWRAIEVYPRRPCIAFSVSEGHAGGLFEMICQRTAKWRASSSARCVAGRFP